MPATINLVSPTRYYTIDRSSVTNLTSATVKLAYDADDGVSDPANLRVIKTVGSQWVDLGGTGTATTTGTITSNTFNSFSYFTLGNAVGGANVLPVELAAFDATYANKRVLLSWTTESEENSAYFEVERSVDGINFERIETETAAGFSSTRIDYYSIDSQPLQGTSYYRLRMVDIDGTFEYSSIRAININNVTYAVANAYPNPVAGGTILVTGLWGATAYALVDASGHTLQTGSIDAANNGIDVGNISSGIYLLRLNPNGVSSTLQIIVQR
jgi:hypothetical protein